MTFEFDYDYLPQIIFINDFRLNKKPETCETSEKIFVKGRYSGVAVRQHY